MRSAAWKPPPPDSRDDPASYEILGFGMQLVLTPIVAWICLSRPEGGAWAALPPATLILTALRGRGAIRRAGWFTCAWLALSLGLVLVCLFLGALLCAPGLLVLAIVVVLRQPYAFLALDGLLALLALVAPSLDREEAAEAARRAGSASSASPGA